MLVDKKVILFYKIGQSFSLLMLETHMLYAIYIDALLWS